MALLDHVARFNLMANVPGPRRENQSSTVAALLLVRINPADREGMSGRASVSQPCLTGARVTAFIPVASGLTPANIGEFWSGRFSSGGVLPLGLQALEGPVLLQDQAGVDRFAREDRRVRGFETEADAIAEVQSRHAMRRLQVAPPAPGTVSPDDGSQERMD